jgi:nucleotide-binding universal stress UspA family protein
MGTELIVVGVDGSPSSEAALDWAIAEARVRGARMRLVTAIRVPAHVAFGTPYDADEYVHVLADAAPEELRAATERAAGALGWARVDRAWAAESAAVLLTLHAAEANLLVLGAHSGPRFVAPLLGSTADRLSADAAIPVVVVRGEVAPEGRVVVGVEGGAASSLTLDFAYQAAAARRAELLIVHCTAGGPDEDVAAAHAALEALTAPFRTRYPGVPTYVELPSGPPVDRLVEAAAGAALLVVGRHAHGERWPALTGSTSRRMLRRAPCPVVVVPVPVDRHGVSAGAGASRPAGRN